MSFTKLHESLVHSTIWREPNHVRVVWVTMMAIADKFGEIQASIPGLADLSRVSIKECEEALDCFRSPDPYSRSKDFDGRRIVEIEGGWALLNHPKYRLLASKDDQKEKAAERVRRHRNTKSVTVTPCNGLQRDDTLFRDIAEAEAESNTEASIKNNTKTKRVAFHAPSLSEVEEYGKTLSPKFTRAEAFIDFYESNGWKVGKNPMKLWQAAVRTWNGKESPNQPAKAHRKNEYPQETLQLPD